MAHVGARAELDAVGDEVVRTVRIMTGLIRMRFANKPELLAAWARASKVVARRLSPPRAIGYGLLAAPLVEQRSA